MTIHLVTYMRVINGLICTQTSSLTGTAQELLLGPRNGCVWGGVLEFEGSFGRSSSPESSISPLLVPVPRRFRSDPGGPNPGDVDEPEPESGNVPRQTSRALWSGL